MDEEKFTKLLRESMELERKIPFPEGEWQSLEQRLEQVDDSTNHWRIWWYILPLLGLSILCIMQRWQLQGLQADMEKIQNQQIEPTDTIIKIIEVQKVDTVYKTIIKERPSKNKISPQDTLSETTNKQDLSFLKKIKTKELSWEENSIEGSKISTDSRPTNFVLSLWKHSITELNFFRRQDFVSARREKNRFDDLFVQAALSTVNEHSLSLNHHVETYHVRPPVMELKEDNDAAFGFLDVPPKDIFSVVSAIGDDLYQQDFGMREWEKRQRNVSAQLNIAYHFPGETIRPYIGLYAASDWQENVMTTKQLYQMPSFDVPPLMDLPSLSSVTFRETTENISTSQPLTVKYKHRVQSIALHQINLWYELNIGLKYTF